MKSRPPAFFETFWGVSLSLVLFAGTLHEGMQSCAVLVFSDREKNGTTEFDDEGDGVRGRGMST